MNAVLTCMVSDTIGPGTVCRRFAQAVSAFIGSHGGFAVREYSRALELSIDCLHLQEGEKVLISPLSPALYRKILSDRKLDLVYADVEHESGCLQLEAAQKAIVEEKPSAILLHAPLGFVPDVEAFSQFDIPLIEDISQSLGARLADRSIGSYGMYTVLAQEAEQIVTTGGGAVVLAAGRNGYNTLKQGISVLPEDTLLSDMNASLGLVQLESLSQYIDRRSEIAEVFLRALMRSKHKRLIQKGEYANVPYSFPVFLNSGMKEVMHYAKKKNVETIPAFRSTILETETERSPSYPVATSLLLRTLLFPLYPMLTKSSIEHVAKVISTLP